MPAPHRHQERPGHRVRPDRHRPGLRVRLLRHPGLPGAARGGAAGQPDQLQPGHDHDRPGVRRRDLHRADHPGVRREGHRRRSGPTRCCATLGGQTALNTAVALHERGVLEKYGVELIGADIDAIHARRGPAGVQGDRAPTIGAESARSTWCHTVDECLEAAGELGYPLVVRPSFTMGGAGSGFAHDETELRRMAGRADAEPGPPRCSSRSSILGWKEYELEVMRDHKDNVVVVCSIENLDPMGVHTGDSHHGGAGDDPDRPRVPADARRRRSPSSARSASTPAAPTSSSRSTRAPAGSIVIEMNPRVSRSSALASKATGFPIAKIAAKLAIGYTLDEIANDITRETPAQLRADAGLRRRQDPAVRLREVPRRRPDPDHDDEVGRRGDGDRPQLHRGAAEGHALDGDQGRRLLDRARPRGHHRRRGARAGCAVPRRPALRPRAGTAPRGDRRRGPRGEQGRPVVPRPDPQPGRAARQAAHGRHPRGTDRGPMARGQAGRLLRPSDRGHLRGRRGRWYGETRGAWDCARCSRPSTRVPPSSRRGPRTTTRPTTTRTRSSRRPSAPRSSSSAAAPTGSARASSSTTPASTRPWRCATSATRP